MPYFELGAEVTLIERGRVGGTAFNSGPAPVRTPTRAARLVRDWHCRHIRDIGVDLVEQAGDIRFLDAHTVAAADGRTWTADRVIIAVGGRAGRLPVPGAELGLTYEDVRNVTVLPNRACIIGAPIRVAS